MASEQQGKFEIEVSAECVFTSAELVEQMERAEEEHQAGIENLAKRFSLAVSIAAQALLDAGHAGAVAWDDDEAPNTTVRIEIGGQRACTVALKPRPLSTDDEVDIVTTWHAPFEGMASVAS